MMDAEMIEVRGSNGHASRYQVLHTLGKFAIVTTRLGTQSIAKHSLGAWKMLELTDIISELNHCDKLKQAALSEMAAAARDLDLQ